MYGEIITIGDELISGKTQDLNARYAADRLTVAGLRVKRMTAVGDDHEMVSSAILKALESSCFVIITGGLGPTDDDMTNKIVAELLNRDLCLDKRMLARIQRFLDAADMEMTPSIEKMAWLPKGSRILNPDGPACGCCIIENQVRLYFLPGIPEQMRSLFDDFVLPELQALYEGLPAVGQRTLKLYGINESDIAETLREIKSSVGDTALGFYPRFPENHITLTLSGVDEQSVLLELDRVEKEIRRLMGAYLFAVDDQDMAKIVGRDLIRIDASLATAESCSGGLIGHLLTNVPGSSQYFEGGVVVYGNPSKEKLLGVNPDTLRDHGAVSNATVREMALGVQKRFRTHFGLAVTGIAGPDGGTEQKPVGTVYIGLAAGDEVFSKRYNFFGNRLGIKRETAQMALDWVRRYINGHPFLPGV